MQFKPENNGRAEPDDDADLRLLFDRSIPPFSRVDVDRVMKDAMLTEPVLKVGSNETSRNSQDFVAESGANCELKTKTLGGVASVASSETILNRRMIMLKRIGVLGVCAVSVCFVLVFALWSENTVLGQVQDALKKVRTASYVVTQTISDQPPVTWKVKLLDENLGRAESKDRYVVFDVKAKKMMDVNSAESKVLITEDLDVPKDFNILTKLMNLKASAAAVQTTVPDREFGGESAKGFVISDQEVQYSVWIDPNTNLPLEMERVPNQGDPNAPPIVEKWSGFRFDEPLDKALFAFETPQGYSVETRKAAANSVEAQRKKAEEELQRAAEARKKINEDKAK